MDVLALPKKSLALGRLICWTTKRVHAISAVRISRLILKHQFDQATVREYKIVSKNHPIKDFGSNCYSQIDSIRFPIPKSRGQREKSGTAAAAHTRKSRPNNRVARRNERTLSAAAAGSGAASAIATATGSRTLRGTYGMHLAMVTRRTALLGLVPSRRDAKLGFRAQIRERRQDQIGRAHV